MALVAALSLVSLAVPAATHQKHVEGTSDSARVAATPRDSASVLTPLRPPRGFVLPAISSALFEHLHNKIVHFPVVLILVAAALLGWRSRAPELLAAVRVIVWIAAAAAVAAFFTGLAQQKAFEDEPVHWVTNVHRNWGIATGVALLVWSALVARAARSRVTAWWGLACSALVAVTAWLGGVISHGH